MQGSRDYELFELGDIELQMGMTLRGAFLAYKTYGTLNADKTNAIVYPTWYSGRHADNEWLIGEDMALDPSRYFIIVPNMLGNGLSSSPSNMPPPYDRARFPRVTFWDQVRQQHRLVTEKFGIETLPLVTGWSMGAGQTYQWAVSFPDMVQRACPFCGSSKTSEHNIVFLEGVKAALTADDAFKGGWYDEMPEVSKGIRSLARVYAGWGSRRRSTGTRCTSRWGTRRSRTSSSVSGRASSSTTATPTTCWRCCGRGRTATSATPRASTATTSRRCSRSRPSSSRSRPRRTCTSRPRTRSTRSSDIPTAR